MVLSARAIGSYRLSFGASLLAASINLVFGFIIAWTLVRYEFPGRKLIDALIDMPFALPTAVSGIALTTVFAQNGWIGRYLEPLGIKVAYTWLGVTRRADPDQHALQRCAPCSRHCSRCSAISRTRPRRSAPTRLYAFRRIILPTVLPALLTGFTLSFARAVGEYGSVIFIAGNLPMKTEITPLLIVIHLEEFDYQGAAALGLVMLLMSFVVLLTINLLQAWGRRRLVRTGR